MPDKEEENFCKKMAKATRGIHAISDALVNAKLAFGKDRETPVAISRDVADVAPALGSLVAYCALDCIL